MTAAAAVRRAVRRGRGWLMVWPSLTRHRAGQRVDDDGRLRGRCWGHVPREPRDRRPGRPGAGPLLGGAARRQHADRRARPVRDPAHGARRARAGPVLPDRARAARPRPPAAPRRRRRRPPGARWSQRALDLGARHLDIGQHDVPWVVLADPEGNPFCVMEERAEYATSGPIAALPLDSADPARDAAFWAELSGWRPVSRPCPPRCATPRGAGCCSSCAPSPTRGRPAPRTGCTSTSGSRPGDDEDAVVARRRRAGRARARPRLG